MAIRYSYRRNPMYNYHDVWAVSGKKKPFPTNSAGQSIPGPAEYPAALVTMSGAEESPNFEARQDWNYDQKKMVGSYGVSYDYWNRTEDAYGKQPTELFTHVPPQIRGAYADPSIRHVMPTLVGIAMNRMGASREVPMADSTLSRYSAALSRNAAKRGLATPNPNNPTMTSGQGEDGAPADYSDMPSFTVDNTETRRGFEAVGAEEVSGARNWVRSKIRGAGQTQHLSTQFAGQTPQEPAEQLKLL
jgi:hypothetical protein